MTGTSPRLPSASTSRPRARACAQTCSSASQPANAEALEAGELRLDGDARRRRRRRSARRQWASTAAAASSARVDARRRRRLASRRRRPAASLGLARESAGASAPAPRRAVDRGRPQLRRVGVDPEDDLRLARGDGCGEPVAEVRPAASPGRAPMRGCRRRDAGVPGVGGYLTAFLRPEPAVKRGTLLAAMVIVSPVRGLRPSRAPRSATWNLPKPVKLTSSPDLERVLDRADDGVDRGAGVLLAQAARRPRPCRRTPSSSCDSSFVPSRGSG